MRFDLEAEVAAPTALTVRRATGNDLETLEWITGTSVRGALAAWYGRTHGSPGDERFQRLFVKGSVRYGCLRPTGCDFWPLSSRTCKQQPVEHPVIDRLLAAAAGKSIAMECECESKYEPPGIFLHKSERPSGGIVYQEYEVKTRRITHSSIDPKLLKTRPGQLYSMRCVEGGQKFKGSLSVEESALADLDAVWPEGEYIRIRIGRARSRGQGEALLRRLRAADDTDEVKKRLAECQAKAALMSGRLAGKAVFAVTLQAPAMVRDSYLLSRTWLEPADVGLGRDWTLMSWFSLGWTVAGWHAAAGVPRSEQIAIAPGSCFLFGRDVANIDMVALQSAAVRLEEEGIGERRIEGMGEVRVCQAIHAENAEGA